MSQPPKLEREYTLDEMLDALHNPHQNLRSLAELDTVIDEIMDRNPEWVEEIARLIRVRP